jgi:hypothetical protein
MNILRVVQTENAEVLIITRTDKEQMQRRDILQCEHCDAEIDNLHNMYKNMGLCEECYEKNSDACWEEWLMTRDACR